MNLAVNAGDAMPDGGTLTLATDDVYLDEDHEYQSMPIPSGRYVRLTVTDTGEGMDAAVQSHVFEPFFSTKAVGKGTGLGLSTVYGVVKHSGGDIEVHSQLGHGCTFTIYLPATTMEAKRQAVTGDAVGGRTGTETILLVEDDDIVRELVSAILTRNGFTVLEAADGADALSVDAGHDGTIHMLLTDVVMPKMGGVDLRGRLVERRKDIKILFMSGYAQYLRLHHGMADADFIGKPFEPAALIRKVREILDR
jgi:CheY-like chemotaxis protein